jgi:hypothetical protein
VVSSQIHAPAPLPPVPYELEAGYAPLTTWTFGEKIIFLSLPGVEPRIVQSGFCSLDLLRQPCSTRDKELLHVLDRRQCVFTSFLVWEGTPILSQKICALLKNVIVFITFRDTALYKVHWMDISKFIWNLYVFKPASCYINRHVSTKKYSIFQRVCLRNPQCFLH